MLVCETKRKLATGLAWAANQLLPVVVPCDSNFKGFNIRLAGAVQTTFGSAPTITPFATIDAIVSAIDVIVDGGRTVKHRRPWMVSRQNLLFNGNPGERRSSGAAAAGTNNYSSAEGGFTLGTTTQYTTVNESIWFPFECIVSTDGRAATWLKTKGRSTCYLNIQCSATSNLELTSVITFANNTLSFDIVSGEAQDLDIASEKDFKQTFTPIQQSSAFSDYSQPMPIGNKMLGIGLLCIGNYDGSNGTAGNRKQPLDTLLNQVKIRRNGREIISTTFQQIQAENRNRKGVNAPFVSNVSALQGYAYLDLLQDGVLNTGLDLTREGGTNTAELVLTSNAFDGTQVIGPVEVDVEWNELVEVKR